MSSDRNSVRLECTVAGDPQPSIRWTKDGKPLEGSPKLKINSNGRSGVSSIVEINDVSSNDQGEYICEASNEVGTVSAPAKVSIECEFPIHLNRNLSLKKKHSNGSVESRLKIPRSCPHFSGSISKNTSLQPALDDN